MNAQESSGIVEFTYSVEPLNLRMPINVEIKGIDSISPKESNSLLVSIDQKDGEAKVTYEGSSYTVRFKTPLGSTEIPVHDLLAGRMLLIISGSVSATVEKEGPAELSAYNLKWDAPGSNSIKIAVSPFAQENEQIQLRFNFEYIITARLVFRPIVGGEVQVHSISERLQGTSTIYKNIQVKKVVGGELKLNPYLIISAAVVIVLVVMLIVLAMRKHSPSRREEEPKLERRGKGYC
ncbi:MAG: hypothetical protein QXG01_03395 [Candidatus Bathyarchaeia archaeon]